MNNLNVRHYSLILSMSLIFTACGGTKSSLPTGNAPAPPTPTYTLSGEVTGLAGAGLVLQNNGANNLAVAQNGSFAFSGTLTSGASYKITVLTQPTKPNQACTVSDGSGTAKSNVIVQVTCSTLSDTVSGSVQGLVGVGLVLQQNLSDSLAVTSNGAFTFSSTILDGTAYSVTVLTQPSGPSQTCSLGNASGTSNGNVTVAVVCANNNPVGDWAWVGGADIINQLGTYGATGVTSTGNGPGSRYNAVSWTDPSGALWTFGGNGFDSGVHGAGDLNDLWKYEGGEWTWMNASNASNQQGVYGAQGLAAPANIPGARQSAAAWKDAAGNFWLFGGSGPDSTGNVGYLNDLWKYSGGQWTWVSGSTLADQTAVYGTKGTASASNLPSGRSGAVEWTDGSGNFWLFGGFGAASSGSGNLNDLWRYSGGEWTWMGGSNLIDQAGVYGTQGKSSASSVPGGRNSAMAWSDAAGNFYLFGGEGVDSSAVQGDLNDMWKYSGGEWTWISGASVAGQPGVYGVQGTASSSNCPGARDSAVSLVDAAGDFWLFGGNGLASTTVRGGLNDIWKYTAGEWTWMSGANTANEAGVYGSLNVASANNIPGGRTGPIGRIDAANGIWIFGGSGGSSSEFNDLWLYQP